MWPFHTVMLNGRPLPTTFLSKDQLQATVPSDAIAKAGTYFVTIKSNGERLPEFESGASHCRLQGLAAGKIVAQFGFAANRKGPEHYAALERVQGWTRDRFRIPGDAPILVSELTCTIDGCPPLQTLVAFWTEAAERHHFKIQKPSRRSSRRICPRHGSKMGGFRWRALGARVVELV